MRKFAILLGIIMLLIGLRLHYNWVSYLPDSGELSIYNTDGSVTTYKGDFPTLLASGKSVRLDVEGGEEKAAEVLLTLSAKVLWTEIFDTTKVIYAYSGKISGYNEVLGKKVNLMLAIGESTVAIGSPILKGSY